MNNYYYSSGMDYIIFEDYRDEQGSRDVLELNGIQSTEVEFSQNTDEDLVISLLDGSGKVTIDDFFAQGGKATASTLSAIEEIRFSDGVSFNIVQAVTNSKTNDFIYGDATANTLTGGKGNDTLIGGGGADTYVYSHGGGNVVVMNDYEYAYSQYYKKYDIYVSYEDDVYYNDDGYYEGDEYYDEDGGVYYTEGYYYYQSDYYYGDFYDVNDDGYYDEYQDTASSIDVLQFRDIKSNEVVFSNSDDDVCLKNRRV